jgi:hypothetical protein
MTQSTPYAPPGSPLAFLVDVDGTVALRGDRSPYDESRVSEDQPNRPVIATVQALILYGLIPLYVSGRTFACARDTSAWLLDHIGAPPGHDLRLFMREIGDTRSDDVVKAELYDQRIAPYFTVALVLDDRQRVVDMWRAKGLTCLQVAKGDF